LPISAVKKAKQLRGFALSRFGFWQALLFGD
jgi:hypothetical protein